MFLAYQTIQDKRVLIYHANIMMALTEELAIICLDAIDNKSEKKYVIDHIKNSGKDILAILEYQFVQFLENLLQVAGANGKNNIP